MAVAAALSVSIIDSDFLGDDLAIRPTKFLDQGTVLHTPAFEAGIVAENFLVQPLDVVVGHACTVTNAGQCVQCSGKHG